MEWEYRKISPPIFMHVLLGVLRSVSRCRAGGTPAQIKAVTTKTSTNGVYKNPVPMVDEDQSNCIHAFFTDYALKVV